MLMGINKCSFCENSYNNNGKLECYYSRCRLTKKEIEEMIKVLKEGDVKK